RFPVVQVFRGGFFCLLTLLGERLLGGFDPGYRHRPAALLLGEMPEPYGAIPRLPAEIRPSSIDHGGKTNAAKLRVNDDYTQARQLCQGFLQTAVGSGDLLAQLRQARTFGPIEGAAVAMQAFFFRS